MKKIVFLLFMSLTAYSVNAQTCSPDYVVDDVDVTFFGNLVTFDWTNPIPVSFPPPPPGNVSYHIEIEWGALNSFGNVTWGLHPEFIYKYTILSVGPQTVSTVNAYRSTTHVRMRVQLTKKAATCEHSWSPWFEFEL